ncbi:MAG: hypothetical protein WA790_03185 [Sulfitobacter sp.]
MAHGKRYVATHSVFNNGRSSKVVAEELGGSDYISLNYYDLTAGPGLFPCEMPADKVIAFLRSYVPDTDQVQAQPQEGTT